METRKDRKMLNINDNKRKSKAPLIFEDAGKIFRADSCEPLKKANRDNEIAVCGLARGNYPGRPLPADCLPGIRSLGMWDAKAPQSWGLGKHCNEGLEISFLSHGNLSFASPGHQQLLIPGDVTVTAPWLVHEVGLPCVEPSRLIWIILDVGVRRPNQRWTWPDWVLLSDFEKDRLARILQNDDRTVWHNRSLAPAFEKLAMHLSSQDVHTIETDVKIQLNTILLDVVRTVVSEQSEMMTSRDQSLETVRLFLARLEEHIDYPWRIEDMAKQCGMSRGTFIQRCRELMNCTPHAFILQLRLRKASELLTTRNDFNLTEIALQCGFSSSAHFSSTFKKSKRMTPTEYRCGLAGENEHGIESPFGN